MLNNPKNKIMKILKNVFNLFKPKKVFIIDAFGIRTELNTNCDYAIDFEKKQIFKLVHKYEEIKTLGYKLGSILREGVPMSIFQDIFTKESIIKKGSCNSFLHIKGKKVIFYLNEIYPNLQVIKE